MKAARSRSVSYSTSAARTTARSMPPRGKACSGPKKTCRSALRRRAGKSDVDRAGDPRAFAEKNFDLVIGVGFAQGPIMQKVATDYPNIKFASSTA